MKYLKIYEVNLEDLNYYGAVWGHHLVLSRVKLCLTAPAQVIVHFLRFVVFLDSLGYGVIMKIIFVNIVKYVSIISCVYLLGFISGAKKLFPYGIIQEQWREFENRANADIEDTSMEDCSISELKSVPYGAIAFIGHSYGEPHKETYLKDFIADSVSKFLLENSNLISKVIFTGDVFAAPSLQKWKDLDDEYGSLFDIHIAPGNHDVSRPASRDVFLASAYGSLEYPYLLKSMPNQIVIDDSVSTDWKVSQSVLDMINGSSSDHTVVARHHIPIKELSKFANSAKNAQIIDSLESLKKQIPTQKTTWIIGDGGGSYTKPRLKCLTSDNHTFLVNGIGEVKGDKVLLAVNGTFYFYTIN